MLNTEELLVEIKADNKQLRTALDQTNKKLDDMAKQSVAAGNQGTSAFNKVSAAVQRFAGPLVLGLAAKKLADLTIQTMQYGDRVGDTAAQLNLSAEAFQELSFAAKQSGIDQSQFEMGVRTMNKAIGEALTGNKMYVDTFKSLGISLKELAGMNSEQQFERIVKGLSEVKNENIKAAAAQDIFSRGGAAIAAMADEQAGSLANLRKSARDLGIVMSEDMIKKMGDANDKFEAMKEVVGANLRNALAELVPLIVAIATVAAKAASALGAMIKHFQGISGLSLAEVNSKIAEVQKSIEEKQAIIDKGGRMGKGTAAGNASYQLFNLRKELADLEARKKLLEESMPKPVKDGGSGIPSEDGPGKISVNERIRQEQEEYFAKLREMYMDDESARRKSYETGLMDLTDMLEQGIIGYDEYLRDKKQLDDDYNEWMMKGLEEVEVTAKKVGNAASSAFKTPVEQMLEAWGKSAERLEGLFGDMIDNTANAFTDLVTGSKVDAEEMAKTWIKALIKIQLQALLMRALTGTSVGKGLMSVMNIGAGKAGGGAVQPGTIYPWKERGQEYFVPNTTGRVVSNGALGTMGGGSPPIRVEVVNKGTPQKATSVGATQSPRGMMVQVVLDDLNKAGPISAAMQRTYSLRRSAR